MNIKLIKSNIDDLKFILKLRNSIDVRKYSINNKIIPLKKHKIWFSKKLKEKKTKIYIIKFNNIRVGYIRTEKKGVNNEISIALLKKFRSKSIGKFALKRFEKINKLKNLSAKVHRKNLSSIYFFYSCGYSIYLKKKGGLKFLVTLFPTLFMLTLTLWATVLNQLSFIESNKTLLMCLNALILFSALLIMLESLFILFKLKPSQKSQQKGI